MKKTILIILIFLTFSCKLTPVNKISGIQNIEEKIKKIDVGKSNKNDIIEILGYSIVSEPNNENIWYYMEMQETRNFFGKKKITKELVLVLEFDNRSILYKKEIYDSNNKNQIFFDEDKTVSRTIDKNFVKDFLSSTRKRLQSAKKSKN
jgi:outer membrane protein assembly factor BamE (lipoprotein component of BamABCDE complex)